MRKVVKKMKRNNSSKTSRLCSFGSLDYMILASTIAIALSEEFSSDEVSILASFFAVLSDELALIEAIEDCNSNDTDDDVFVAPIPSIATITLDEDNKTNLKNHSNLKKKKIIKKKRKKIRKL